MFLARDLTRHDIRELLIRGLRTTHGNYRALLRLFSMEPKDYKRFHNFLMTYDCRVDYRKFRRGAADAHRPIRALLPSLKRGESTTPPPPDTREGRDPV
jgi:hypothetical protein